MSPACSAPLGVYFSNSLWQLTHDHRGTSSDELPRGGSRQRAKPYTVPAKL